MAISRLHDAIRENSPDAVKALLTSNPSTVNTKDPQGKTPLHLAAELGAADIVSILLETGADDSQTNAQHDLPLHVAIRKGHLSVVTKLLMHNKNRGTLTERLSAYDQLGNPALLISAMNLNHCAPNSQPNPNEDTALDILKEILKHRPDTNQKRQSDFITAIHIAANKNRSDAILLLEEAGANVDSIAPHFKSPLQYACGIQTTRGDHPIDAIRTLIDLKATVNAGHPSPLSCACYSFLTNSTDVIKLLIDRGAKKDSVDLKVIKQRAKQIGKPASYETVKQTLKSYRVETHDNKKGSGNKK